MNSKSRDLTANALGSRAPGEKLRARTKLGTMGTATVALLLGMVQASFAAPLLPVPISTSPSNGDLNPYGVLFVTNNLGGTLQRGDILVSNFNNSANVMFLGTTIVDIRNGAQTATPFYTATTAGEGLGLALGQLKDFIIIGNVPTIAGPTAGPGALTVLNSSGAVVNTLTDPAATFIDGPWGMAINQDPAGMADKTSGAQIFVSNVLNGTVWRLDVAVSESKGVTINDEVKVGSNYALELTFPTVVNGPAGLAYDAKHDTLYVASELDNEIFAITDAGKIATNQTTPGTVVYSDNAHLYGPTGLLLLGNGDLLTANDDGVNTNPAEPSELVEFTPGAPTGTFVTQLSIDPANGGAFAIGLVRNRAQTVLGYVDDNEATLSILSLFTGF